jgi:hypothetical protein
VIPRICRLGCKQALTPRAHDSPTPVCGRPPAQFQRARPGQDKQPKSLAASASPPRPQWPEWRSEQGVKFRLIELEVGEQVKCNLLREPCDRAGLAARTRSVCGKPSWPKGGARSLASGSQRPRPYLNGTQTQTCQCGSAASSIACSRACGLLAWSSILNTATSLHGNRQPSVRRRHHGR